MKIPHTIREQVSKEYGAFFGTLGNVDPQKISDDVLNGDKPHEQIAFIKRYLPKEYDVRGKKLLEIGSGFGIFNCIMRKEYGMNAWGIEPSGEGFGNSFEISQEILKDNGLDASVIKNAVGEHLPFPDASFDIVYSTNVLEHVNNPEKVIAEAIRVCKSGGIIQIVVPSYGSFYDGHYACLYFPYQPLWLWKLQLKYILHRDASFADTLRTNINYFSMRRWVRPHVRTGAVEVVSYGEEIFYERMTTANFSAWAGLKKIKPIIQLLVALRLAKLAARVCIWCKAFTPIVLTLRKK